MVPKIAQIVTGTGAAGAAGIGVAGWQIYETYVPNQHRKLSKENYVGNLPQASDLGAYITDTKQIEGDVLKFSNYKCFDRLFPGAVKVNESNAETGEGTDEKERLPDAINTVSTTANPIGCSIMQLSHINQQKDGKPIVAGMLFKSEIVVRNDKEGLALWAVWDAKDGTGHASSEWKQTLNYRLVYLAKDENGTWEAKYGYQWEDVIGTIVNISAYIEAPNGNLWLDTKNLGSKGLGKWQHKEFVGIWKVANNGKGIFNDMEVRMADDDKCEIMCKGFEKFKDVDPERGFQAAKYYYSASQKKGFTLGTDKKDKVPEKLDDFYKGIKNAKGEWKELNRTCHNGSTSRNDENREDLINFCYTQNKGK